MTDQELYDLSSRASRARKIDHAIHAWEGIVSARVEQNFCEHNDVPLSEIAVVKEALRAFAERRIDELKAEYEKL